MPPPAIARDYKGRDISKLARQYHAGLLPRGFGGDGAQIAQMIAGGMSAIDANFIADYVPIDKDTLLGYIARGTNPYDALSILYGGPYLPNVDPVPAATYKHPSYVPPVSTYLTMLNSGAGTAAILTEAKSPGSAAAATGTSTTPTDVAGLDVVVSRITGTKIGGIPIIYLIGGGLAAYFLIGN